MRRGGQREGEGERRERERGGKGRVRHLIEGDTLDIPEITFFSLNN